ncbi:MAG: UDP-N-acetylglucosamine pyrophosphorylase [Oscillospiraceae bacterium]|jgi:NDP-sugar pyrophosphorylase family protein|nr:UDP-N-acetylglucosamine pyrophosphorylase [Oscillospiraceae bacterium]
MFEELLCANLLDLSKTLAAPLFESVRYPFEVLPLLKEFIISLIPALDPEDYVQSGDGVYISKSAVVAASACIDGPCIIGAGVQIRHCAFLRGSAIVGENAVIGNSVEIKNSVIFTGAQVPHFNYVGDSILGHRAHFGAGVITSNVKSDKSRVRVTVNGQSLETGLRKFGAVAGDFAEIGCNTVLNPGTVIGRNANVYPLSAVRGFVPSNSIYKKAGEVVEKLRIKNSRNI